MLPENEKSVPALEDKLIIKPKVVKIPFRYYRDKTQKVIKEQIAPTVLVEKLKTEIL
jgi:hypothetical protein